jgi:hypothetical protein
VSVLLQIVAVLAFGQVRPGPAISWKELDRTAKPLLPLASFKHLPIISSSEAVEKKGAPTIRIYRYTYRGDLDAEIARLKKIYKSGDGWIFYPADGPEPNAFERVLKKGKVRRQAFLISSGKWVRKDGVKGNVTMATPSGEKWVKISHNEELAKK